MTDISAPKQISITLPAIDRAPVIVTGLAIVLGALTIGQIVEWRQALLYIIGALLGLTLYHASFGFTGSWRRMLVEKRGHGIRAQMLMIGIAAIAMFPLLAQGSFSGQALVGATAPIGISVLVGAIIFGLGMQLGGGCGSGTLFTVGGGSARMLVTLIFFIIGAVVGSAHLPWWLQLPSMPATSIGQVLGVPAGIAVTLAGLALVAAFTIWIERRTHGSIETKPKSGAPFAIHFMHGPWPLVSAAIALALLNISTLIVAGHPWSVTFGFGLWGAKVAQAIGIPVETWEFWNWPGPAKALSDSVLANSVSVMNFGIILGAALAASLAGKFAPKVSVPLASFIAAAIGGLIMGYGARLAFGCNIGALFSGIASGSLHGWLWFAAAFFGSYLGTHLRPLFGLDGFKAK